jgi:hypothetical protein
MARLCALPQRGAESEAPSCSSPRPAPRARAPPPPRLPPTPTPAAVSRRALAALAPLALLRSPRSAAAAPEAPPPAALPPPDFALPGPFEAVRLPALEHVCASSRCDTPAEAARVRARAWAPKGGARLGRLGPYPLAVITPGYLVPDDQ